MRWRGFVSPRAVASFLPDYSGALFSREKSRSTFCKGQKSVNQSTIIFGYLAVAFFIFITQRGELPVYWGFLVSTPTAPASGPAATASGSLTVGQAAQAVSAIAPLAALGG